jgi:AraC family transcriptional regulator
MLPAMRAPAFEAVIYGGPEVRVGKFRCPVDHPEFPTAGPIEGYTFAFPRSAVWIQHAGEAPFVADQAVVTVYNLGQPYVRGPLAPDGDRVDWFSVGADLAMAVAREADPRAEEDPARPFRIARAPCDPRLYLRQRLLLGRIERGELSDLGIAEEVVGLLAAVLRRGTGAAAREPRVSRSAQLDVVEAARAELARNPADTISLRDLAVRVEISPYHLCRIFHRRTGRTLHEYRLELRIRAALEQLPAAERRLSGLAHRLGFSSHSHFGSVFRRVTGSTPSRVRNALIAEVVAPA